MSRCWAAIPKPSAPYFWVETLLRMTNRPLGTVTEGSLSALQDKYRQIYTALDHDRPSHCIGTYRHTYTTSPIDELKSVGTDGPTIQFSVTFCLDGYRSAYAKGSKHCSKPAIRSPNSNGASEKCSKHFDPCSKHLLRAGNKKGTPKCP